MKATKFFYVLIDKALKPRLALNQTHLFECLQQYPDSYVKTFFTKEEASRFVDYHLNMVSLIQSQKSATNMETEEVLSALEKKSAMFNDEAISIASKAEKVSLNEAQDIDEFAIRHNDEFKTIFEREHRISPENTESSVIDHIREDEVEENVEKEGEEKSEFKWNFYYFYKEEEKAMEKARKALKPEETYHLFFDGASSGNPGPSGVGYAIFDKDSKKLFSSGLFTGIVTNNVAEYSAVIFGLKTCQNLGIRKLVAYGDSQLVINQLNKKFQVKTQHLWKYFNEASTLMQSFESIELKAVPREQNAVADALSKKGVSLFKGKK